MGDADADNSLLISSSGSSLPDSCAICYETFADGGHTAADEGAPMACRRAALPCCGRATSSTAVCIGCLRVMGRMAPGGVARCPLCRNTLKCVKKGWVQGFRV